MEGNVTNKIYNIINFIKSDRSNFFTPRKRTLEAVIKEKYGLDTFELFLRMLDMCDIAIKIVDNINKNSSKKHIETLEKTKLHIKNSIGHLLNERDDDSFIDMFNKEFEDILLAKIENCSDFINDFDEKEIENGKIKELADETLYLIKEIKDSEINNDLKTLLLLQLYEVHDSLLKAELFGYEAIESSVIKTVGTLALKFNNCNDSEKTLTFKLLKLMTHINEIFEFAKNVALIAESYMPLYIR